MKKQRIQKGPKTLEEKLKAIDPSFADEVRLSTPDQIKDRLIRLDRYEDELIAVREEDQELRSKRDVARAAGQGYSEPIKAIKLKRAFSLKILSEKGDV